MTRLNCGPVVVGLIAFLAFAQVLLPKCFSRPHGRVKHSVNCVRIRLAVSRLPQCPQHSPRAVVGLRAWLRVPGSSIHVVGGVGRLGIL
jgi:hypothetical protein